MDQEIKQLRASLAKKVAQASVAYDKAVKALAAATAVHDTAKAVLTEVGGRLKKLDEVFGSSEAEAKVAPASKYNVKAALKALPAAPTKKLDGRSKEARALKAKAAQKAKPAKKVTPAKKAVMKAAKKPVAKAKAAPAKKVSAKTRAARAIEGRRAVASGARPPLKEAMTRVMGSKTMNGDEILKLLNAKGWGPNSSNPVQHIKWTLSTEKTLFERVPTVNGKAQRGFYKVKAKATAEPSTNGNGKKAPKVEPVTTTAAPATPAPVAAAPTKSAEDLLADMGVTPREPAASAFTG